MSDAHGGPSEAAMVQRGEWLTLRNCRNVLVIVSTVTYAQRLRDAYSLLAGDLRVQVVFTVAPHPFGEGVSRYLGQLGIPLIPWEDAVRIPFHLALAAGSRGIEQVQAPVIRLSHGAGHNKPLRGVGGPQSSGRQPVGMLSRRHLMHGDRVVPAAVAVAHTRDLEELARSCPEALPVAHVVGDPCHDRIVANVSRRKEYRRALGISAGQKLILVTSTWGPSSVFGRWEALVPQLVSQLPAEKYQVATLIHPNVWAGHGNWQVRSWLSGCLQQGVAVIPPEQDWEALLIAADAVVGDHGSLTAYTTLTQAPILLTHASQRQIAAGSPAALLDAAAPTVSPLRSLEEQLQYAAQEYVPGQYDSVSATLTSEPGRFHRRMRALMYRVMGLGEPAFPAPMPPLPMPPHLDTYRSLRSVAT